ncbi:MAG: DUF3341 domain-containing protein [Calditrichae bacterium]|nr:DUF3341 domain-containing protein [Calditrichota bacterium]MCB9058033.1 DUF3341 domain-containing protein [Calditrichia bacterium]
MSEKVLAVLAEFKDPADLLHAAEKVKDQGFKKFDCHSPFPIHGMDDAMGEKRSPLGYVVGVVAVISVIGMFAFQGWTSAIDYPLVLSGKPLFSYQAYGVASWAVMVLLSAIVTVIGMMVLIGLPRFHHPLFYSENFSKKVNDDGFFVSIEADDPQFEAEKTKKFLESIGGKNIELVVPNEED